MPRRVALVGVGLTKTANRRKDITYPELTFEAVNNALSFTHLKPEDIDAVVYGSMDPFDGLSCPEKWNVDSCASAGVLNKPLMKISTGGTTGGSTALAGYYNVASGLFDVVLAVASQRVGETIDAQQVLNTCLEPCYERPFGFGAIMIAAMQATSHMHYYGTTEEDLARVAVQNHEHALNNPHAHLRFKLTIEEALKTRMISWPLKLADCCPSSDGACALIFASEEKAEKITSTPAWIKGAGQITDGYYLGDRTWYHEWDTLATLARRVYKSAKIYNPFKEIDVAEVYTAFSIQQILEYEALGFCEKGEGGKLLASGATSMNGSLPVCPSGSVICTNPIGASGLIRVGEAALQVMGKAEGRQVPNVKLALAHAWGATIGFHTLMILSKEKP
ncbi:MAG: thiolase family protein [Chloroflexi bacterium]|nr:thiolase family protein [Chloroflexota bacterium]